jgi:hypothetical protein
VSADVEESVEDQLEEIRLLRSEVSAVRHLLEERPNSADLH